MHIQSVFSYLQVNPSTLPLFAAMDADQSHDASQALAQYPHGAEEKEEEEEEDEEEQDEEEQEEEEEEEQEEDQVHGYVAAYAFAKSAFLSYASYVADVSEIAGVMGQQCPASNDDLGRVLMRIEGAWLSCLFFRGWVNDLIAKNKKLNVVGITSNAYLVSAHVCF